MPVLTKKNLSQLRRRRARNELSSWLLRWLERLSRDKSESSWYDSFTKVTSDDITQWKANNPEPSASTLETEKIEEDIPAAQDENVLPVDQEHENISSKTEVEVTTSQHSRLYALLVAIDNYEDINVKNLSGCVNDLEDMEDYLVNFLHVDRNRIIIRKNEQATREVIIDLLRQLALSNEIQRDDPILFFFAGHGAQVSVQLEPTDLVETQVEMRLPYDFIKSGAPGTSLKGHGIWDFTFNKILADIVREKGDNITVIFDSCHSGSGLRDDYSDDPTLKERTIELKNYTIPFELLKSESSAARDDSLPSADVASYTLMAACRKEQTAKEQNSRGNFTKALVKRLRETFAYAMTNEEIIGGLPDLGNQQNPQCEGVGRSRQLWRGYAPPKKRLLYTIERDPNDPGKPDSRAFILHAGNIDGVTAGAEFFIYSTEDVTQKHVAVIIAENIEAYTTAFEFPNSNPMYDLTKGFALLTKAGTEASLRLYMEQDDRLVPLGFKILQGMEKDMKDPLRRQIILASSEESADFKISVENDNAVFDVLYEPWNRYKLRRLPSTVPIGAVDKIYSVIAAAADFFWHLRRTNSQVASKLPINVKASCYQVVAGVNRYIKTGEPLDKGGIVSVISNNHKYYGYEVENKAKDDLFIWAFTFHPHTLEVELLYTPPFEKAILQGTSGTSELPGATNPTGLRDVFGYLAIGFADSDKAARAFVVGGGRERDVHFTKFFASTEFVNLSHVQQPSPFAPGELRDVVPAPPISRKRWDTVTLTIDIRRDEQVTNDA